MILKNNIKIKLGFSLLELSAVLLVTSVLMTAVIKGSDLIDMAKINSAKQKTINSPIWDIDGLMVWYEPTLDESFDNLEADDGKTVSTWHDISGNNPNSPKNAVQSTPANRPIYESNTINDLPVLRFDGTSSFLSYDGTFLANSDYTIFIVEQRRSATQSFFLGSLTGGENINLHLGYLDTDTFVFDQWSMNSNRYDIAEGAYTTPIPRIHSYRLGSASNVRNYNVNGSEPVFDICDANCVTETVLSAYNNAQIGRRRTIDYYTGDIAEIIMFTRYINDQERQDIEAYLSSKYDIPLQ
jgi:prepilin-type N-terminal cleavage/methylation domain-containing protein